MGNCRGLVRKARLVSVEERVKHWPGISERFLSTAAITARGTMFINAPCGRLRSSACDERWDLTLRNREDSSNLSHSIPITGEISEELRISWSPVCPSVGKYGVALLSPRVELTRSLFLFAIRVSTARIPPAYMPCFTLGVAPRPRTQCWVSFCLDKISCVLVCAVRLRVSTPRTTKFCYPRLLECIWRGGACVRLILTLEHCRNADFGVVLT